MRTFQKIRADMTYLAERGCRSIRVDDDELRHLLAIAEGGLDQAKVDANGHDTSVKLWDAIDAARAAGLFGEVGK